MRSSLGMLIRRLVALYHNVYSVFCFFFALGKQSRHLNGTEFDPTYHYDMSVVRASVLRGSPRNSICIPTVLYNVMCEKRKYLAAAATAADDCCLAGTRATQHVTQGSVCFNIKNRTSPTVASWFTRIFQRNKCHSHILTDEDAE